MEKRTPAKDVEIAGRKWRILRMDARLANYLLTITLTQVLPVQLTGFLTKMAGLNLPAGNEPIGRERFIEYQNDILSVCREVKLIEGKEILLPVLLSNGDWGVAGIDTDPHLVIQLVGKALWFNLSSFFDAVALKGVGEALSGMNPSNANG